MFQQRLSGYRRKARLYQTPDFCVKWCNSCLFGLGSHFVWFSQTETMSLVIEQKETENPFESSTQVHSGVSLLKWPHTSAAVRKHKVTVKQRFWCCRAWQENQVSLVPSVNLTCFILKTNALLSFLFFFFPSLSLNPTMRMKQLGNKNAGLSFPFYSLCILLTLSSLLSPFALPASSLFKPHH